jgi:putative ABC transport system substrate-binding protein
MHRRLLLALGGFVLMAPLASIGQQARVYRVGVLMTGSPTAMSDAMLQMFRELGYIEGRNITIERRQADGNLERLPGLAAELLGLQPEVILALGTPASLVLKRATVTVPIVFAGNSDPQGVGIVASLAKPGGNITGTSLMASELSAKRLELLRALTPQMKRIAILWDSSNPGMALRVRETQIAADQSRVLLRTVGPKNLDELQAALADLAKLRPDALLVTTEPFTRRHLARIVEFSLQHRIPTMFEDGTYVEAGGLMSYGPNVADVFRRAVLYADKILKGAKPGDLPVEQPTTFELIVNLKTAKALGIAIPQSMLVRADRVIE